MRRRGPVPGEGGFVLPVALLVLVILSMVTVTGMVVARGDFRAAEATRQAAVALAAADAGAARTIALWSTQVPSLPAPGDSAVVDWQELPDGSRYRSVVRRAPVGAGEPPPARVLVLTTAVVRPPGTARRTVATVVEVTGGGGPPCCRAGVQLLGGVRVTGARRTVPNSGVDGTDRHPTVWPAAWCPAPPGDLPGVLTSDTTLIDVRSGGEILGSPPVLEDTAMAVADLTDPGGTPWADLTALADVSFAGDQRLRDVVGPVASGGTCDLSTPTNWGAPLDPGGACGTWSPVVHVAGNLVLQGSGQGQGVLLVDGDLQIDGEFHYYGLVVVQGRMRLTAPARVHGAVLVRGGPGGTQRSDITDGARVEYSSCAVERAMAGITTGLGAGASGAVERSWFEVVG